MNQGMTLRHTHLGVLIIMDVCKRPSTMLKECFEIPKTKSDLVLFGLTAEKVMTRKKPK